MYAMEHFFFELFCSATDTDTGSESPLDAGTEAVNVRSRMLFEGAACRSAIRLR